MCGTIDHTHFDGDITVDIDGFVIDFAADVDVLVRLHAAGAEAIELVGVDVYTGPNLDQLVGNNTFYGDHAVTARPAGPSRAARVRATVRVANLSPVSSGARAHN